MPKPRLFHRLLVANRGEVAVRIARACDELGVTPIFAVSAADRDAPYTRGRESICIGPARSRDSYLDPVRLVMAAKETRASAIHPGWGFLAENPRFALLAEQHGVTFVGPPAHVMELMGKKTPAKRAMKVAGLMLIPGSDGIVPDLEGARKVAGEIGYPILVKAESGGGGRGMRIARSGAELDDAFSGAQQEAAAAFGDERVYIERLLEGGRHVEIQIIADRYGNVCHLGERDCTIQRKHQKLIEESPSPALTTEERDRTLVRATRAAASIGYVGAGTMEFLLDDNGTLRFMEMNTRLQVEHPVSEMRTGIDLAAEQIKVAAGNPLSFSQDDVTFTGHAIECRVNAEDPENDFRPSPGTITRWDLPRADENVRIETHAQKGYTVPPHYDSLIAKLIVLGTDREDARKKMIAALGAVKIEGIVTNVALHLAVLQSSEFSKGLYDTTRIPGFPG